MIKLAAILLICLSQSACLVVAAVEGVTEVAIAVVKVPIKIGGAVVDAVSDDDDEAEQED